MKFFDHTFLRPKLAKKHPKTQWKWQFNTQEWAFTLLQNCNLTEDQIK